MDISVVFPLIFVRGPIRKCIRSWTKKQKLDRDRFAVVFVSPGDDPATETLVRELMGPHDQLVFADSKNLYALYDRGVRAARGRIALITESHCMASPRVLRDVVDRFERTGCAALCCRAATPKNDGYLADMEGMLFEEEVELWGAEGHWRKVHERGFAIRRDVYAEQGGFPHQYGWFAGRVFAARLREAGIDVDYARDIVILHYNSTHLSDIEEGSRSFAYGEMRFRQDADPAVAERYFGRVTELEEREELRPALARTWLRARLWRLPQLRSSGLRELAEHCPTALFGLHWHIAKARLRVWYGLAQFAARWPFGPQAGVDAFRDLWHNRMVRYHRLCYLRDEFLDAVPAPADRFDTALHFGLVRFYALERRDEITWRLSKPTSAVRFRAATPRPASLTLSTAPFGDALPKRRLALFLDGQRLLPLEFSDDGYRVTADLRDQPATDAVRTLAIVCDALRAPSDPRALGIPLRSLDVA